VKNDTTQKLHFFLFFGNFPPNDSRELPKKGNIIPNIDGIKNTLEVVSLLTLVKTLFSIRTIRITRKAIIVWSIFLIASYMVALINIYSPPRKENDYIPVAKYIKTHSMNTLHVITCRNKLALPLSYYLNHQKVIPIPRSIDYMKGYNHED